MILGEAEMRHFIATCVLPVLLGGCPAHASEGALKPEDRLVVYPNEATMMTLHNGRFEAVEDQRWLWPSSMRPPLFQRGAPDHPYSHGGRTYRMLSGAEKARMDAMQKVEVRQGKLYFDGRRIKTNARWVKRVYAAYHWNGGVVVGANTSKGKNTFYRVFGYIYENEIGFLDLVASKCKFTPVMLLETETVTPEFMEPVRIDTNPEGIALDVALPDKVFLGEGLDIAVSLTNRSSGAIQMPNSLAGGLQMMGIKIVRDPSEKEVLNQGRWIKLGDLADPGAPSSPLGPNDRRASVVPFDVRKAVYADGLPRPGQSGHPIDRIGAIYGPGSYRILFQWDGFLDPGDRRKMSRVTCERRLEVVEPTIDTSNGDLRLDVKVPEGPIDDGKLEVRFSLTNVSDRAILVPDNIVDGLGLMLKSESIRFPTYYLNISSMPFSRQEIQKLKDAGYEVKHVPRRIKHSVIHVPYQDFCSPLQPNESRESVFLFDDDFFGYYIRSSLLESHWDCLLDPDDRGKVTRFTASERSLEAVGFQWWGGEIMYFKDYFKDNGKVVEKLLLDVGK